ncbi:hypothetical protein BDW71DRAFT_202935 [Aspergillus fruticulosus]
MRNPHIGLTIALHCFWSLFLGTAAQECETSRTVDPESGNHVARATSPEQLSAFRGCTTLTGDIFIEREYRGDFILNGVTKLKGTISTPDVEELELGRAELRDLVETENIYLLNLIGDAADGGEVDLGSLVGANNIYIRGSWTSIKLKSLKTIIEDIQFCGGQWCGRVYGDDERQFSYLEIDLPSLEKADYFDLQRKIKSISVPSLEVVGYIEPTELVHSQGLRMSITEGGKLLDFDGPKLHTLNGSLQVYGAINSLSLGALGETTVGATFNTRGPLKVYSTIQTASHFYLWVDLERFVLPPISIIEQARANQNRHLPA